MKTNGKKLSNEELENVTGGLNSKSVRGTAPTQTLGGTQKGLETIRQEEL